MAKKETKKDLKPEKVKDKKGKGKKDKDAVPPTGAADASGIPPTGAGSVPLSQIPPDQMNTQMLEQALKDSQDPESRLKKLRSPLNVRSCLLNILFLIILTLGIVILWCFIQVDKFSFGTVAGDMLEQFGIKAAFQGFWEWLSGLFGG